MKLINTKILIITLIISLFSSPAIFAASTREGEKLAEGIHDIITSPKYIPEGLNKHILQGDHHLILSVPAGILEGTGNLIEHSIRGFIKILTFKINC